MNTKILRCDKTNANKFYLVQKQQNFDPAKLCASTVLHQLKNNMYNPKHQVFNIKLYGLWGTRKICHSET